MNIFPSVATLNFSARVTLHFLPPVKFKGLLKILYKKSFPGYSLLKRYTSCIYEDVFVPD